MNLFQTMALVTVLSVFAVGSAFADDTTPGTNSSTNTSTNSSSSSSPDTIHIGETYEEHLQNEMNQNAAKSQQPQQNSRTPQSIGRPIEIDGVNQQQQ